MHTVAMRLSRRSVSAVLALTLAVASCSSSDDGGDTAESTSIDSTATAETAGDEPGLVDKSDETEGNAGTDSEPTNGDGDSAGQGTPATASVVTTVLPAVPEIGVPGTASSKRLKLATN